MTTEKTYHDFLHAKAALATGSGFDIDPAEVHPILKPHQRDIVCWAVRGGRRAIFAAFGLGKSVMQLEIVRLILARAGGRGLIVCPLGVRQEFVRDAAMLGLTATFIRTADEADRIEAQATIDGSAPSRIYLTNYESVRDGKLDPRGFTVISLDEAAILRGFGGTKTFRELMRLYEGTASYRFVATATPSPNEYIELLAYAAFLDIMDIGQGKTRWFKRDSTRADVLTLYPHKAREFWLWMASWAFFLQKPSDLGYSDDGYVLPDLDVRWHEIPAAPVTVKDAERDGQQLMFRDTAMGVSEAAREKRESLEARVATLAKLVNESPGEHFILWHDLEDERRAIQAALPEAVAVWGSQDLDEREQRIIDFSEGRSRLLSTKPVIAGSGCNFQRHCHRAIFLGIGFKFNEFIQAIHRIQRFLQPHAVRVDLIYTEAERAIRRTLERKWSQHVELVANMGEIIREYGLSTVAMASSLRRHVGVARQEISGEGWRIVNADAVEEAATMPEGSVHLIVTSIPFANQYEYTPSFNDFGNTEDTAHFWRQMDYLTPSLYRILAPGRVMAIHVKDRVTPGGINGLGFQTVTRISDQAADHYERHGFAFLARITITTDVVRENNQTYRLGYTEQCKDGSRMGRGLPEYVLLFRKPPTDQSNGYADYPIVKDKAAYSLGRWQIDAAGDARSSGDRYLSAAELAALPHQQIYRAWRRRSTTTAYDYEAHVRLIEAVQAAGRLPVTFALLPPHAWHDHVWSDVARMRTYNMDQQRRAQQFHVCPLQTDIADRLIASFSQPGEVVFDPFAGIGTVPARAVRLGRVGWGVELSAGYVRDAAFYCDREARRVDSPSLFDAIAAEDEIDLAEVSADSDPATGWAASGPRPLSALPAGPRRASAPGTEAPR